FLADRYIVGTCPKCGNPGAYGDQCEKCGSTLSPEELIDPKSKLSGVPPIKKKTTHWYLPLDNYEQWLREWILEGHKEWRSNVYGQVKSWLDGGLQPRAVTRDLDWGVPVPVEGADGKVLYVWFDAPIGYISNTRELLPDDWEKWWKSEDTKLVHFIGKDNIVFHCIVFPSMLKAYGDGYILPENVPANEFLNLEGEKISTSRGWAVWAHEYLKDFPGKEDVLRYVLTANAPETKDNDFSWKDFQTRNNSELVAVFGNFVNRAVVLTHKYFGGCVPACGSLLDIDKEVLAEIPALKASMEANIENYKFREALKDAMGIARIGNKYISDTEPWKVAKTDMDRCGTILNISLQICADLGIAFEPFTPFSAAKLRKMLGSPLDWEVLGRPCILPSGHRIEAAELLFAKVEDDAIQAQLDRLEKIRAEREAAAAAELASKVPEQKEECSFEDFEKMDIRTATVLEAEKVPKTDKLLKLTIDTGIDRRVIVSGIAEYYTPEEMVGKQICILANLKPRVIKGIESKGMILMAKQADGKMRFVTPQETLVNGAVIG
ncbi:MAG: methionine--tRNA ligase, partial [Bacteroidales bacterium]|nr:methionine--tRNA ligase [Bacteroidales bacterium]